MIEHIYGIDYTVPEKPKDYLVPNRNILRTQQKWERQEILSSFEGIDFDEDDNPILTPEQLDFVENELERIQHGYYFFNNGELTYITGVHYFYLKYFTLEDGTIPEYRDADRKWFYFLDYCYNTKYITGIIRIKKRREGASSHAACFLLWQAITSPNSNCGIVSKTGKDAQDVFQKMIVPAFNKLPVFLKPRVEDAESKTSLVFAKPKQKKKGTRKKGQVYSLDRGLESKIDYRATQLNSYDSGRVTAILIDEGGKWSVEVPINKYWPIVKKTLMQGIKRVGFALIVSTVNDAENGGSAFKELWDDSDHFNNKITGTGLYRYFSPAYEGFAGFIDEYGHSITENASAVMKKLIQEDYGEEYDGSKDYLLKVRSKIKDPEALSEEIRMNPFTEKEAFMISQQKCHFNVQTITDQIEYLQQNPPVMRTGKFYKLEDGTISWMDVSDGPWMVFKFPKPEEINRRHMTDRGWAPSNNHKYCSGIDPHRHNFTKGSKELSKTSAWIGERLDSNDPENTGLPIAWYYDRPREKSIMHAQIFMACQYYGTKATYETDAGDDHYDYAKREQLVEYIRKTPTCAMDPQKPGKKVAGVSSRDPFALGKQIEFAIAYFERYANKINFINLLKQALIYEHDDRQVYDEVVSFMIMLIDMVGDIAPMNNSTTKTVPVVRVYNLYSQN